jgi:indolepyruvate ferredoxin oxidoreductase, alpha subunit
VNSAITGANGGFLIVVADDPSMHSSQNEQDSREYGAFAGIPVLEPGSQQEAYDLVFEAFDLSEQVGLPVMMRITTRLAHSRADIVRREPLPPTSRPLPEDPKQFVLLPANARRNYAALVEKQADLEARSARAAWNELRGAGSGPRGILAAGLAGNYVREALGDGLDGVPFLHLRQYPAPRERVRELAAGCEELLVVEEGAPVIESRLLGLLGESPVRIRGRLDGSLPRTGELDPDAVAAAWGIAGRAVHAPPDWLRPRPPQLCKGCPHVDSYIFLNELLAELSSARVFSDIGCYTLGALPPFNAIHTCVDMGASVTMAKGASDAGIRPSIAVIGDSTFTHSGMTGLLDCVYEQTPVTVLILDNETTGMTGRQDSLATGRLESICRGIGVEEAHLRVVEALRKNHEENLRILREEAAYEGVSVVIARRACVHNKRRV